MARTAYITRFTTTTIGSLVSAIPASSITPPSCASGASPRSGSPTPTRCRSTRALTRRGSGSSSKIFAAGRCGRDACGPGGESRTARNRICDRRPSIRGRKANRRRETALSRTDGPALALLNRQLLLFERAFLSPEGIPAARGTATSCTHRSTRMRGAFPAFPKQSTGKTARAADQARKLAEAIRRAAAVLLEE